MKQFRFCLGVAVNYTRSMTFLLALTVLWLPATDASSATLNKCIAPDGRVEFTDRPCPSDAKSSSIGNKISSQDSASHPKNSVEMDPTRRKKDAQAQSIEPGPQNLLQPRPEGKRATASIGLPAEDRLKSCDPNVAIAATEEILHNPENMKEPLQLFPAAFALFQNGRKDDAVFWFYAAQLRVRQQIVVENGDRGQLLSVMLMTMGPLINNYAFQNIANLNQILERVVEWDKKTANPFREKAKLQKLDKQIEQVYVGFRELQTKLVTEKSSMEATARQAAPEMAQTYAQINSRRCRQGQPDPAYENQLRKAEEQLAMEYITHNPQLIKLVGGPVKAFPSSSTSYGNDKNRGRYDFSISGPKQLHAIVDVIRKSGKQEFTLACVTTLSIGYREAGKDACSQSTIPLPR